VLRYFVCNQLSFVFESFATQPADTRLCLFDETFSHGPPIG
jgi:hypothetical protein